MDAAAFRTANGEIVFSRIRKEKPSGFGGPIGALERSDATFVGIPEDRLLNMTDQGASMAEQPQEGALRQRPGPNQWKAARSLHGSATRGLNAAKSLRRALRGEDVSPKRHKERFIEFVHLGAPSPKDGKNEIPLFDSRTQKIEMYSFRKLVYAVRWIAIHENDSLDAAQPPNYHIR